MEFHRILEWVAMPPFRGSSQPRDRTQVSCTAGRFFTYNHLGRLCVYGIYKRSLSTPTKENALVVIAVDIGGKNTWE